MKRIGFLPVFFLALTLAFVAALLVRVRTHDSGTRAAANQPTRSVSEVARASSARETEELEREGVQERAQQQESAPRVAASRVPLLDPTPPAAERSIEAAQPSAIREETVAVPPRRVQTAPAPEGPRDAPRESRRERPGVRDAPAESQPSDAPPGEADESSDSTPPQLISIQFTPPEIADGEETLLTIEAVDDLSGVRGISGTILAPSGAVQGFAGRPAPGNNRYVTNIRVPKDAAEGVWSVNYINLSDNASNAAAISAARGGLPPSASFRVVSSRPDTDGPTLQAIWVDRRSMRGGEKNTIFVRAFDEGSGVNLISGVFQSPSRNARVGFVCRNTGTDLWACELTAPACADCGDWQLEQLQLQDKVNNMTTLRAGQSDAIAAVRVDVSSDMCDDTPPALQSLSLEPQVVSNAEQSMIMVRVTLADDACGTLSVSGQATGPAASGLPPRLYFSFQKQREPQTWVARIVVPRLAAKGMWRISFLQVLDRGQNLRTYTASDPLLAPAQFNVE